ncbi:hypothetical protein J6590_053455 [Homalodisca vitripennis]|nr:hypothetical protein J6590_053455 [Homalodisca vitripennis]
MFLGVRSRSPSLLGAPLVMRTDRCDIQTDKVFQTIRATKNGYYGHANFRQNKARHNSLSGQRQVTSANGTGL